MPANTIKIFVDAHVFDKEYQGTRTFIKEIYTQLLKKPRLLVYMGAYDVANLQKYFGDQGNLTFVKYASRSSIYRLLIDIPRIIRQNHIDLAHFQYISPLIKNCRQVVTIHDLLFLDHPAEFPFLYRWSRNFLFRRSAKKANVVTTISQYSKESIHRNLGIPRKDILLVQNAVSENYFGDFDREKAKQLIASKYGIGPFLLCVSRIEPRKNHITLLKAFLDLELYKSGYCLVMLGHRTTKVKALDELLHGLHQNIRKQIFVRSDISEEDKLQFYRAAECCLYISRAEGFGLPPLEAAATRTPIICSKAGGMKEFDFFSASQIEPDDYEQLKTCIKKVLSEQRDNNELQEISKKIRNRYSWVKSADQLYKAIGTLQTQRSSTTV